MNRKNENSVSYLSFTISYTSFVSRAKCISIKICISVALYEALLLHHTDTSTVISLSSPNQLHSLHNFTSTSNFQFACKCGSLRSSNNFSPSYTNLYDVIQYEINYESVVFIDSIGRMKKLDFSFRFYDLCYIPFDS